MVNSMGFSTFSIPARRLTISWLKGGCWSGLNLRVIVMEPPGNR